MFVKDAQYLVTQGAFDGFVFSPIKISSCGTWAWISKTTRVHIKHVDLIGNKRHAGRPFELAKAIATRRNREACAAGVTWEPLWVRAIDRIVSIFGGL